MDILRIVLWTGLAGLPWVFKMFWGPLVDLSFTKRQWTVAMQVFLFGTMLLSAGAMHSHDVLCRVRLDALPIATFSATHDIACDGLYLMSLDLKRQAAFSGVMATFSRLGRLFVASVLLVVAGYLSSRGLTEQTAWSAALAFAAFVYGAGMLWNFFMLPRPLMDAPVADVEPGERAKNIWRTLTVVAAGVVVYYLINGSLQLIAYAIFHSVPAGSVPKNWDLKINAATNEFLAQWIKIGICAVLLPMLWWLIRVQVRGTVMSDAFVSYVRQPGFGAIFAFIVFYRFGEAMVFAMASLFILDKRMAGGMEVSLQQLGLIQGVGQVGGLITGGLLGGWYISQVGLRRAFFPLVICMHVPNLLYIWAAWTLPRAGWLYPVSFCEAFGYGFGFAGYFVYLMHVAQRGRTSPAITRSARV